MKTTDKHYPPDGIQCPHITEGVCKKCNPMKTEQIKEEYLKLGSGTIKSLEFWLGVLSSSRQELLKEIAEKVEKYRRDKDFRRIPSGLKERVNDYQNGVNDTLDTVLSILSKMSEGGN